MNNIPVRRIFLMYNIKWVRYQRSYHSNQKLKFKHIKTSTKSYNTTTSTQYALNCSRQSTQQRTARGHHHQHCPLPLHKHLYQRTTIRNITFHAKILTRPSVTKMHSYNNHAHTKEHNSKYNILYIPFALLHSNHKTPYI